MATSRTSVRVTVGEPRRISPPGMRCWFPRLFNMPDGSILQFNATVDDDNDQLSQAPSSSGRLSRDGGHPWVEFPMPGRYGFPHALADGRVRSFSYILWERPGGGVYGLMSDLPKGGVTWTEEREFAVDVPSTVPEPPDRVQMCVHRTIMTEPDGTLLATMRGRFADDEKKRCLLARSKDSGATWDCTTTIAYDPSLGRQACTEPVMARVADGSLLAVVRTGSRENPLYQTRSFDDGQTWSKPESLGVLSVDPELCLLRNGILALSFGRPTANIMFSPDGSGKQWTEPTTIFSGNSTCYTGLREVSPGRMLLVYDSTPSGSPWQVTDNQVNAVFIDVG